MRSGKGWSKVTVFFEPIVIELLDLLLKRCRFNNYCISPKTLEVFFQLNLRPVKVVHNQRLQEGVEVN